MKKLVLIGLLSLFFNYSYAQTPNWLWAIAPTSGSCYISGYGISGGTGGDIYISGRFSGTLNLGGQTINNGCTTVFSGRLNSSTGNADWLVAHPYTCGID